MAVSLAALPKGHEFAQTKFAMTPDWVSRYCAAVEDQTTTPPSVPPLALATLSIRALLEQAALPEGAIHVSQDVKYSLDGPPSGEMVAKARVGSRGERAGWVLMGIELEVQDGAGTSVMAGRAIITFPAAKSP
jgi:hypothetical protein